MDKLVLTVPELAKVLELSTATVYVMVRNNEIPYKKLRGKIVFHRETIEKWLATPTAN
ncbi:helix-turn-helix domain-containing protein [Lysinibacillus sphaericus]|uniref:helix-turn-helix domain-containing protein n=1 Tax=Lysinibacillus sphaericus TaxID=1421 RepID=UPI0037FA858A